MLRRSNLIRGFDLPSHRSPPPPPRRRRSDPARNGPSSAVLSYSQENKKKIEENKNSFEVSNRGHRGAPSAATSPPRRPPVAGPAPPGVGSGEAGRGGDAGYSFPSSVSLIAHASDRAEDARAPRVMHMGCARRGPDKGGGGVGSGEAGRGGGPGMHGPQGSCTSAYTYPRDARTPG